MVLTFINDSGSASYASECADMCVTEELDGSRKTLSFSADGRLMSKIRPEMTVEYGGTRYTVKEIYPDDDLSHISVECVIDLSELDASWIEGFEPPDLPYSGHSGTDYGNAYGTYYDPDDSEPAYCAQDVVSGLYNIGAVPQGWTFEFLAAPLPDGSVVPAGYGILLLNGTFTADKATLTNAVAKLASMIYGYGGAYQIDNLCKVISLGAVGYGKRDYGHAVPFVHGHNLRSLTRTESSRQMATRLYAYGKDGLTLESVCEGRKYVEDHTFTSKVIPVSWTNSDISDAETLKKAAEERLAILAAPTFSCSADVINLYALRDDAPGLDYRIGDYARVQDPAAEIFATLRIVKTVCYPDNPEKDSVELSTAIPTLEDFDARIQVLSSLLTSNGKINGVYVHGIKAGDVVGIETVIGENETIQDLRENAVVSVVVKYAQGTSQTVAPTTGWSTEAPEWEEGKYVWQKIVTTYIDGSSEEGSPECLAGATGADGADAVLLRIDSSRGNTFKNNSVSTVLRVVIYCGSARIENYSQLQQHFPGAYLQWEYRFVNDETWHTLLSTDERFEDHGFRFVISPADVDVKVDFRCSMVV